MEYGKKVIVLSICTAALDINQWTLQMSSISEKSIWALLKTKGFKNPKSLGEKKKKREVQFKPIYDIAISYIDNSYAFWKSYLMKDIALHSEMSPI